MTTPASTRPPPVRRFAPVLFTIAVGAAFLWMKEDDDWKTLVAGVLWFMTVALLVLRELDVGRRSTEPDA